VRIRRGETPVSSKALNILAGSGASRGGSNLPYQDSNRSRLFSNKARRGYPALPMKGRIAAKVNSTSCEQTGVFTRRDSFRHRQKRGTSFVPESLRGGGSLQKGTLELQDFELLVHRTLISLSMEGDRLNSEEGSISRGKDII